MTKDLNSLLTSYKPGYSLEQAFYVNEEVLEAEWESIFKKHWLFAGSIAQIPKAGDYFVYQLRNDSVIIIRGNNGEVYAHHNTCTHRGSALCLDEAGHAAKLICPYHQWVFDKDGTLLKARLMDEGFCTEPYNLRSVSVKVCEGMIFICLAENPPLFDSIQRSFSPYIAPFELTRAKLACRKVHRLRANWKLVAENFRECYHCGGAHPEYCNAVIGANLREGIDELTIEKQQQWKAAGLETLLTEVTPGTTSYAIRYPLRPGIESYSIDGKKVSVPMGMHKDHDAGVVGLVNYPNFWMDAVSDYIWTMRVTPINAHETETEFCWFVHENAVEGKDYLLSHLTAFWDITGEQDAKLCENNFRGIKSNAYKPGPYAPVEDQVINFVDWCVNELRNNLKRS
jgi:glycine betaine catabolism A